ncbi:hypothetical protein niasHS_006262 [Heterodera schachtii]|uniref:Uncharacterized protein n=1 Tax=Heterodera schachtii TaxID=97005 RepID=A0ABD2JT29_HETSC
MPIDGGSEFVKEINASLSQTDDECSRSVRFIRATFDVAASHADNDRAWGKLAAQFRHQTQLIDLQLTRHWHWPSAL